MSPFFERAHVADDRMIRLIDEDPDLFKALPARARHEAGARAVATVKELQRGCWDGQAAAGCDGSSLFGLLVLDGLLIRSVSVSVGREPRSELVGPGDLMRPWEHEGDTASMPFAADWRVLEPTRLAILDARCLAVACRWPALVPAILGRAVRRSHDLALQLAISDVRHIHQRLLLFFWHLADRWGTVSADGVAVPTRLTHEVIAQLVGAQRPTVTTALQALSRTGLLTRRADRTWLLAHRGRGMGGSAPRDRGLLRPRPGAALHGALASPHLASSYTLTPEVAHVSPDPDRPRSETQAGQEAGGPSERLGRLERGVRDDLAPSSRAAARAVLASR
jgi:CRP/FNR family transcriptional regulator, cyclic AMP receptor protein